MIRTKRVKVQYSGSMTGYHGTPHGSVALRPGENVITEEQANYLKGQKVIDKIIGSASKPKPTKSKTSESKATKETKAGEGEN